MFGTINTISKFGNSGISLLRILGGISKSLGIAREIMPIYKEIKPLIQKFPQLLDRVNSIKNYTVSENDSVLHKITNLDANPSILSNSNKNNPSFFQ